MKKNKKNKLIKEALQQARGDIIIAEIGENAKGVAVGKDITQHNERAVEEEQPGGMPSDLPNHLVELYDTLVSHLSSAELSELSFRLGIDEEIFPEGGKGDRARQMIMHSFRRGRIPELEALIQQLRPNLD